MIGLFHPVLFLAWIGCSSVVVEPDPDGPDPLEQPTMTNRSKRTRNRR